MHLHTLGKNARRYAGDVIIVSDNAITEFETVKCVHCQQILFILPGSGKERGWCMKCMGPLCNSKICNGKCVPLDVSLGYDTSSISRTD